MAENVCQIVCLRLVYNFLEDSYNASLKRTSEKLIISAPDGMPCPDFGVRYFDYIVYKIESLKFVTLTLLVKGG